MVLRPWWAALVHRRGWNRQLVALLLFTVVALVVPFYALSTMLFARLRNPGQYASQVLAVVHRLEVLTGIAFTSEQNVRTLLASRASSWLPLVAGSVPQLVMIVVVLLFALYFLFTEEEAFLRSLRRYLPFRPATLARL